MRKHFGSHLWTERSGEEQAAVLEVQKSEARDEDMVRGRKQESIAQASENVDGWLALATLDWMA